MSVLPSLFLSHGAPDLPLGDHPAKRFLCGLADRFPRPEAIVSISAHWEASRTTIGTAPRPHTVHDFSDWPATLYDMSYPARTDPALIGEITRLFNAGGIVCETSPTRGYDHGVWVPLSLVYPKADIPVMQISLTRHQSPSFHLELGRALAPLRKEGVLIVGSGASVHNLRGLRPESSKPPDWALAFEAWLETALDTNDLKALLSFPRRPDSARLAHPTPEHLMPLFVSLGAGLDDFACTQLHKSFSYGSIGMTSYAFGAYDKSRSR